MAATATMVEGALDLSSKNDSKTNSPVPSIASEPGERSSSVSSEGHETDGSTGTAVKPVLGPLPTNHHHLIINPKGRSLSPRKENGVLSPEGLSFNSPDDSPSPCRPFKAYPFDTAFPNMNMNMYSQMAAAAAASSQMSAAQMSAVAGLPMTGTGVSPFALFDSAISLTSPVGQYLQQRKRRMETKGDTPKTDSHGEKTANSSSGEGTPDAKKSKSDDDTNNSGELRDGAYWERRRKNNEAAKRSRDARRAKEEEIALRAAFLEQENLKLRAQVAILKNETAKLHYMLYNRV